MKSIIATLGFVLCTSAFSQSKIDSIYSVWLDETVEDTSRVDAFVKYIQSFIFKNPDTAVILGQELYDFTVKKKLKEDKGLSFQLIGTAYHMKDIPDSAEKYYDKAILVFEELESEKIMLPLNNLGLLKSGRGDYNGAVESYLRALKIVEKKDDSLMMAKLYNNIGLATSNMDQFDRALEYHNKSLAIKLKFDDIKSTSGSYQNIGLVYAAQENTDKALEYYQKSLELAESIGYNKGMGSSLNSIGRIYLDRKEYRKAKTYFMQSVEVREAVNDKRGLTYVYVSLGHLFNETENYAKAKKYGELALTIAESMDFQSQIKDASKVLYKSNKELGNISVAFNMLEQYIMIKDTLMQEEKKQDLIQQQFQYDYDKKSLADSLEYAKQKEIDDLALENEKEITKKQQTLNYILFGGIGLMIILAGVIFNRFRISQKQKSIIEEQKIEVVEQKEIVEEKNKEILDSINYAKRIQDAILPPGNYIQQNFENSFVYFEPKDIVAGDFYWFEKIDHPTDEIFMFAVADCTGHGVPGALVSVVCSNALHRVVFESKINDPGKVLDAVSVMVREAFTMKGIEAEKHKVSQIRDGMDIALCYYNKTKNEFYFSGANNPLYRITKNIEEDQEGAVYLDDRMLIEYKATKQPIGASDNIVPFETQKIKLEKGDSIYLFSDGFADQFGGDKGKKYKYSSFKTLLLTLEMKPMKEQKELLLEEFESWKSDLEQVDDVCVIGMKL